MPECDVCVVGAGAAGAVLAAELGRRGIRTIVLESGPRHPLAARARYAQRLLRGDNPWRSRPELDRYTTGGEIGYALDWRRARGVGGSTLHWEGYALRLDADDFRLKSRFGLAEDWPVSYDELEPYYVRAERALGVAGDGDDAFASARSAPFPLPPFPFSYSDRLFARACRMLGIAMAHLPQARNSIAYGGRPACVACATCHACPTGAKASVDLTHIDGAERTDGIRVQTDAVALRLELDAGDRVERVVWAGPDRRERRLSARVFVLAAGAVENPRLLLLSRSARFPRGLANSSGLVGQRFMAQPTIDVTGRLPEPVYPYRIGFSTAMSRQFAADGDRGRRAGFLLEFLNSAGGGPARIAAAAARRGEALRRHVGEHFGRTLGIRVFCEHLPARSNAVSLSQDARDSFGHPAPHIAYSLGPYEHAGLRAGRRVAEALLVALGASGITATTVAPSAHQIGTHRMGLDPRASVVDAHLQAHDVENLYLLGSGAFVTAGSSPPTLTICALAVRAADDIAQRLDGRRGMGDARPRAEGPGPA